MDGNRHDAERCLVLAEAALAANNISKATRLLSKSRRMYPLHTQQDRLESLILASDAPSAPSSQSPKRSPRRPSTPTPEEPLREPTPAMVTAVRAVHVARNKSHYEVLGVDRSAELKVIKRSYRKLALSLHPDRNCAEGADDAFKRVGNAFAVLSDSKRRAYYDQTGADDPVQSPSPQARNSTARWRRHTGGGNFGFDEFAHVDGQHLSAEELFDFFFRDEGIRTPRARFTRARPRNEAEEDVGVLARFKQIIFMFAIILLAVIVAQDGGTSKYALRPTRFHSERHMTSNNVPYFTQAGLTLTTTQLRRLEVDVDVDAYREMMEQCERERARESFLKQQSHRWLISKETRDEYRRLHERFEKPWCSKAFELRRSLRNSRGY